MVFKEQTLKSYLEHKHNLVVKSIYQINKKNVDYININSNCEIAYFVDVDLTSGYNRFNMKQLLNVVQLDFSDLLKYVRKTKLDEIN